MLKKKHSLSKKKDFKNILESKKSLFTNTLIIKFKQNDLSYSRFAVLVSKKISKKAVIRNKQKRRIKAIIRQDLLKIQKGIDVVIITKPDVLEKSFTQLSIILNNCFKKLNIIEK
jgi:ribonuclease P protein component